MRSLSVWIFASLLFGWATSDISAMGGAGTEKEPFIISSLQDLQAVQDALDAVYVLDADIDATETREWNDGQGFQPISTFTGHFDGRGHFIYNLYINRRTSPYQGLFGVATGALIENVHLKDVDVTADHHSGGLAGYTPNSRVFGCSVSGRLTIDPGSSDAKSGGLIGDASRGSHVDRCFSEVDVYADRRKQVGSLIGYLRGVSAVTRLTNSYSHGSVFGQGFKQGNLLGDADGSEVDRCYSTGLGKALIGFNYRDPVITNSYWDKDRGASFSNWGGVPKTTAEMMRRSTFVGWDFETIWEIIEDETYPYFIPQQTQVPELIPTLDRGALLALSLTLAACGLFFLRRQVLRSSKA